MSKSNGVAHKAIDAIVKFKAQIITDIGQFKTEVINGFNGLKDVVKEAVEKHNSLAAHVTALEGVVKNVAGFAANSAGQKDGTLEARFISIGRSIRGVDMNVLAMAEILKEVIGQHTQTDAIFAKLVSNANSFLGGNASQQEAFAQCFQLDEADTNKIRTDAENWYKDLLISAFKKAQEEIRKQELAADAAYEAEQQKAKEAAEQAAEQTKTQAVEDELKRATQDERSISASTSGGPGSAYPPGAEIFGG